MGTLERANRHGVLGSPLWKLDLGRVDRRDHSVRRWLILEPYATAGITQLNAWVEEEVPRYVWESDFPDRKPTGEPKFTVQLVELDRSHRRGCAGIPGLGYTIIKALAKGELVGESADDGMHGLFWAAFVDHDEGLYYLNRFASRDIGEFYARQRLSWSLRQELGKRSGDVVKGSDITNPVAKLIDDVTNEKAPLLGLKAWQRATVDDDFYDALHALATTNDPVSVVHERTMAFLKLHKPTRTREA